MMRGFARSIFSAMPANRSARARSRSAATGISAVSRAIALRDGSAGITFELINRGSQIAAVAFEQLDRPAAAQPEAQQDCQLQVAVRLLEMTCRVAFSTADDLPDNSDRAAPQFGIPRSHVHHQAAVDAAHFYHHGGRKEVKN